MGLSSRGLDEHFEDPRDPHSPRPSEGFLKRFMRPPMFSFEVTSDLRNKQGWIRSRRLFATEREACIEIAEHIYALALMGQYVIVRLVRVDTTK